MQIKMEHFTTWRGAEAVKEDDVFKTALLLSDYGTRCGGVNAIRDAYSNANSPHYSMLSQYNHRSMGIIVYAKLILDEALSQLPASATVQATMLMQLNETITSVYVNPYDSPLQKIQSLLAQMKQIVAYDEPLLSTKEKTIALGTSFYLFLQIADTYLNDLGFSKRMLAKTLQIDLSGMKAEIASLLANTELRLQQLHEMPSLDIGKEKNADEAIQALFNAQYVEVLSEGNFPAIKVNLLAESVSSTINRLQQLINSKSKITPLATEITAIDNLLQVFIKNDEQVTSRKYCLELIQQHQDEFNLLLPHLEQSQQNELNLLLDELHSPASYQQITTKVAYGMSWLTALPVITYRLLTPSIVQQSIASVLPPTSDSSSKQYIRGVIEAVLAGLNEKLLYLNQQQITLIDALAAGNMKLKEMLYQQPNKALSQVIDINQAVRAVIQDYAECVTELQQCTNNLCLIKSADGAVTDFIVLNNTFYNKLIMFLARISELFVTDTVLVLKEAQQLKQRLADSRAHYQQEISKTLTTIEQNPALADEMKKKLTEAFNVAPTELPYVRPEECLKPQQMKLMIRNLSALLADNSSTTQPLVEEDASAPKLLGP